MEVSDVSQSSAEMRLFSENLHAVTSRSWYNFVETRHIGWTNGKLCSKLHIIINSCVKKNACRHIFFNSEQVSQCVRREQNNGKISTQTCPRTSKVAHGRVLVSQNGAESYHGQSSWSVVLRGQSLFVVSRFCGQSSWSLWSVVVVSRSSWMVFIFYGGYAHVFTETYGWEKPRSMSGQMYARG